MTKVNWIGLLITLFIALVAHVVGLKGFHLVSFLLWLLAIATCAASFDHRGPTGV